MSATITEQVLDKLEAATVEQHAATMATLQLCRTILRDGDARTADDDEWLRMPSPKGRCPISRWSLSTIKRRIEENEVRGKKIGGLRYYSGADVRKFLNKEHQPAA